MLGEEDQRDAEERPGGEGDAGADADERADADPAPPDEAPAAAQRRAAAAVLELDDGREQAPADGEPDRHGDQERGRGEDDPDERRRARSSGAAGGSAAARSGRRATGADRATGVDLDERTGGRRLDEREPEERQRRADHEREERKRARALPGDRRRARSTSRNRSHCSSVITTAIGIRSTPIPRKRRGRWTYIARRGREDLTPRPRRASRSGATGTPGRADRREHDQAEDRGDHEQRQRRAAQQQDERLRALRDAAAEQVGRTGPEDATRRHRVAPVAPVSATTRSGASTGPSCSGRSAR